MPTPNILIVEDELIIAREIRRALTGLGYRVSGLAASAAEARAALAEAAPDLVLMDVRIDGAEDGVQLAAWVRDTYALPVVFLTAFSDVATLERIKTAEPYGYIVKPFDDKDLRNNIELALQRHAKDRELSRQEAQLRQTLTCLEEAVVTVGPDFGVELLNRAACALTGICWEGAAPRPLAEVLICYSAERRRVDWRLRLADLDAPLHEELTCFFPETGQEKLLAVKVYPIVLEGGERAGWTFVLAAAGPAATVASAGAETDGQRFLFVKKGKKYTKVSLPDVLWIEALDNYVVIHTRHDQFVAYASLKDLEQKLPGSAFLKVHRSFIVNLEQVEGLAEDGLTLAGRSIPVSRSCKEQLRQRILLL